MLLFLDSETTGLPRDGAQLADQPHIVQLAAVLTEEDGRPCASMNVIILPAGWTVPAEAAAVHGLDTATCERCGVHIDDALRLFDGLHRAARRRIAHNLAFDEWMLMIEAGRDGGGQILEDPFEPDRRVCTMTAAADLVGIAPTDAMMAAGRKRSKMPTLQEAHQALFGRGFDAAHSALADLKACMAVYFELVRRGVVAP